MAIDPKLNDLMVFLVEPSTTQANFIQMRLKEVGIRFIRHFNSAAAALDAMSSHPPHITISAMYLNNITGADLAVAIRTNETLRDVAFILVTSIEDPRQLDLVRQAGACSILPKPFSAPELRLALDNAINFLDIGKLDFEGDIEHVRVLIVDDSRSARIFLRHALESMGFRHIGEAENGLEALNMLGTQQVDMVFSDFNMPEMNGLQLLQRIRQESWQSAVPVVIVSSENNPEHLAALQALGISGICGKPFEISALKALVEQILNESQS